MDDWGGRRSCSGNQSMDKINISHSPVTHCCLLIASMISLSQVVCGKSHTLPNAIKITLEWMSGSRMNHKSAPFGLSINHVKFELGVLIFSCTIKGLTLCVVSARMS